MQTNIIYYTQNGQKCIYFFLPKNKLLAINFHLIISEFFLSGKKGDSKSSSTESGEGIRVLNMMTFQI